MNVHRLSSSDKIALEKLRAQVVAARRWHHAQVQKLDALWSGFPAEIAGLPPSQRAVRIELRRRAIDRLTASVPPSVFQSAVEAGQAASPAPAPEGNVHAAE